MITLVAPCFRLDKVSVFGGDCENKIEDRQPVLSRSRLIVVEEIPHLIGKIQFSDNRERWMNGLKVCAEKEFSSLPWWKLEWLDLIS